jgi:nucleoid-associated protein YgaU
MEDIIIEYLQEIGEVDLQMEGRITINEPVETKKEESEPEKEVIEKIDKTEENEKVQNSFFIYVIKKGDTLKKIARNLFGKENDWKRIYKWNNKSITNPDRIRIGQELIIYTN